MVRNEDVRARVRPSEDFMGQDDDRGVERAGKWEGG